MKSAAGLWSQKGMPEPSRAAGEWPRERKAARTTGSVRRPPPPKRRRIDLCTWLPGSWRVERDHQEMKAEVGLDHFEGRTWNDSITTWRCAGARDSWCSAARRGSETDEEHRAATPDLLKKQRVQKSLSGRKRTGRKKVQRAETEHWTPRASLPSPPSTRALDLDTVPCAAIPSPSTPYEGFLDGM